MFRYVLIFIGILAGLSVPVALAAENQPTAMVVEVEGPAPPGLKEFIPIETGKAYVLPESTLVGFNHLALCQYIRVKGGVLTINEKDFSVQSGKVLSSENVECPKKFTISRKSVFTGLRLRQLNKKQANFPKVISWELPTRPVIFLRGKNASSVNRIKMQYRDKVVIELPASRDPMVWPASAAPLKYFTSYLMELVNKEPGQISKIWVRTMAHNEDHKSAVIILYVE